MRKNGYVQSGRAFSDRSWVLPFFAGLSVSFTILIAALCGVFSPRYTVEPIELDVLSFSSTQKPHRLSRELDGKTSAETNSSVENDSPRLAYLITGTKGDSKRMTRILQAVYHPRNRYILHFDLDTPPREMMEVSAYVKDDPIISEAANVHVIAKPNMVTYRGPTMVSCTLHAIAVLLKENAKWDWFINLSVSDYPLMTQDDILHVFSSLPRDLNFIEHSKSTGWKLDQRARPIIIDPGLYLPKKYDIVVTTDHRELPTSFNLFTGSAWVMLTRSFSEYCVVGWDNVPRTLLMYYTNFVSSSEGYFPTVICNSEKYRNTAISHDLHYIPWDDPPKQHPRLLTTDDFDDMVKSGSPFARKFTKNDSLLDRIDRELLGRSEGRFIPGSWCIGRSEGDTDPCSSRGDGTTFRSGPGAERLGALMQKLQLQRAQNISCTDK